MRIQGGGTRGIGGPTPGEVCSVAGITGITLYEPGALTLVAAAGTPVAEIDAALAAENQRLPFEPMDHRNLLGTTGTRHWRRCLRQYLWPAADTGRGLS